MPMLTQRAIMLAKIETTAGQDAAPTVAQDAIQVIDPIFSVDPTVLERRFSKRDFSNYASLVGRKLAGMRFSLEVTPRGTADQAPAWARLFEACGMARSTQTSVSRTIAAAGTGAVRSANITTFTATAAHGFAVGQSVTVTGVTDSTFNGTFLILSVPSTTTFTVSNPGTNASSGGGSAALVGGIKFLPVTDAQKTITLRMHHEGKLHTITGAMGTFALTGEAGQIATIEFTFTGNYTTPSDVAFPSGDVYDNANPYIVEHAGLSFFGDTSLVVNSFRLDIANDVRPRADVNAASGYRGVRIVGRNPTGGIDPEAEANHTFWQKWEQSQLGPFSARIGGTASGNIDGGTVLIEGPATQITGVGYGDRESLRTYDLALAFRRGAQGNDEFSFLFD